MYMYSIPSLRLVRYATVTVLSKPALIVEGIYASRPLISIQFDVPSVLRPDIFSSLIVNSFFGDRSKNMQLRDSS